MTGWQARTEPSHTQKDCPVLVSQGKPHLLINSLDNFNVSSKSKLYTYHKHILINFDSTRWRCLISAYCTVSLDRELTVQFVYFSDFVMTGWYHQTQKHSTQVAAVTLLFSFPRGELLFWQTILKGLAKTLYLTYTTGFFSRACISIIVWTLILYLKLLPKSKRMP